MVLQARKKGGDKIDARNLIETRIVFTEGEQLDKGEFTVTHTIEVVSGVPVTHGGGAEAGTFLHYKSVETDTDSDGDIDYSETTIHTTMHSEGECEIKVVAKVVVESELVTMQQEWAAWNELMLAEANRLNEENGPDQATSEAQLQVWIGDAVGMPGGKTPDNYFA